MKQLRHHLSLLIGMYLITLCLFWYETGSLETGAMMGIASSGLKTFWCWVHHKYFGVKDSIVQDSKQEESIYEG